jgi:hypothetical protein
MVCVMADFDILRVLGSQDEHFLFLAWLFAAEGGN